MLPHAVLTAAVRQAQSGLRPVRCVSRFSAAAETKRCGAAAEPEPVTRISPEPRPGSLNPAAAPGAERRRHDRSSGGDREQLAAS